MVTFTEEILNGKLHFLCSAFSKFSLVNRCSFRYMCIQNFVDSNQYLIFVKFVVVFCKVSVDFNSRAYCGMFSWSIWRFATQTIFFCFILLARFRQILDLFTR